MKTVLHQLGRFKRDAVFCVALTTLEVAMEILLPFITAIIIDQGLEAADLSVVYRYGALMVGMAFLSLIFGASAGRFAAGLPRDWPPTCARASMTTSRPFPFPTSTSSASPAW